MDIDPTINSLIETIEQYKAIVHSQRLIIDGQREQIAFLLSHQQRTTAPIKKRGRPSKGGEVDWASWFEDIRLRFIDAKAGRPNAGVVEVLTLFFEKEVTATGRPAGFVRRSGYQTKLRTLAKRISDARHPMAKLS